MSGEQLKVTPSSIRQAASKLDAALDRLDSDVSALESELSGFGQPWGADDIGTLMGICYQGIYDLAMDCFGSNLAELDDFLDGLDDMAAEYEKTEKAASVEVNRVRELLG